MLNNIFKFCLLFFSFQPIVFFAQELSNNLTAKFIMDDSVLNIDGKLDENIWSESESIKSKWQYFPNNSELAKYPTTFKIIYSEKAIYIGIKAESQDNNYVVSTLKRDFGGTTNDNITLLFDTFKDGTNAYAFGVTPYGVQRDILISSGGAVRSGFNGNWNVKWQAESQIYDNYYTVEIVIPFSSIKFEEGAVNWKFRAYRWNLQNNEQTTSVQVPPNQFLANLAFMGDLFFEKPLGKSKTPLTLIPYVNTFTQKDFTLDNSDTNLSVGMDAKISVGDGMNLDLTINPDFSNVEVDDILTNLTRFELFQPERRQFFIDNSDLFSSFGNYNEARPFFSRRIGLASDKDGNLIQNKILAGARLSGKINQNWRLGLLSIITDEDTKNEIGSNNNTMIALQRKVFSRSNIGMFLVNRQSLKDYDFLDKKDKYNRVLGIDYNLASSDNKWNGKFYLHKSFQEESNANNLSSQATLTYNSDKYVVSSDFVYVDEEYRADLGFVPRKDVLKFGNSFQRIFYPKRENALNRQSITMRIVNYWKPSADYKKTDHFYVANWRTNFKNNSNITAGFRHDYIFLNFDFDPTRTEGAIPISGNNDYYFNQFTINYQSSQTKLLTFNASSTIGGFFNGNRYSVGGQIAYRTQPWAQFSLGVNYDAINLPKPHSSADIWLITPRIDVTFSKSLYWTTLIQYSNQRDNLGVNSRLQWRFAPLSDLFLVYNDNYFTRDFGPKFRSINLKLTYWLNL